MYANIRCQADQAKNGWVHEKPQEDYAIAQMGSPIQYLIQTVVIAT